jgi:hypothetical protein
MNKKIWVAITAHNPLRRINPLINVLTAYERYPFEVFINIYINYEAQGDVEILETILSSFKHIKTKVVVAEPGYQGWYLTWSHKTDLALAILNNKADYYVYQENDMVIPYDSFKYWMRWKPRLAPFNLEPGFIRYENYQNKKVPFDNHYVYSLTHETPKIWGDIGFSVPKILVVDWEVNFFAQVASPYYGAMILDQEDGQRYIRSESYDPELSYRKVGIRNWPIADRSSMGLAFEDIPQGYEHRRCIPIIRETETYKPQPCSLLLHDDTKYAPELYARLGELVDCESMFKLGK